jgi:23S rRNA (uracil1939-C5)-methyltransferase
LGLVVGEVLGIEGSHSLCLRARDNAVVNQLEKKVYFVEQNLFEVTPKDIASWGTAPYWIIDPPRDGAFAIVNALAQIAQSDPDDQKLPKRIVYISCNPATLARDAGVLVNEAGYQLSQAGIMNMFAHTSHVESMALFIRFD